MSLLFSLRGTACASIRFESPTIISWIKARSRALLCVFASFLVLFAAGAPAHAANNAAFVSQSVPTAMIAGSAYSVNVMLSNNGTTTWTTAGSYALGSQNPENGSTWGMNRVALPSSIAPGGLASFSFQVTAPSTPGNYSFQWRVVQDGVEWFGPYTPNVAVTVSAPTPGNAAQVVSANVQATMAQGQSYPIAVTMRNTGTTTWPAGATYRLGSTNPQNTMIWGVNRVNLASAVAPGQQYTFAFNVVAPAAGSYTMGWGMVQENVQWFGGTSSSAVTVTPPSTDVVTYIHTDGLGSPVARTDAAGSLVSKTRYEPYGLTAAGATPTIGFTGHVNDADTGLVYMQQRYYDPVAGRFLSVDPVVTEADTGGSFNRYVYANNSPYNYTDPDGREARTIEINCMPGNCITLRYVGEVAGRIRTWYAKAEKDSPIDSSGCLKTDGDSSICIGGGALGSISTKVAGFAAKAAGIVAQDGTKITGLTGHGVDRVIGDSAKRAGTKPDAILDALQNPAKIKEGVDSLGRAFKIYTGKDARVVINPESGQIISTNPLSGAGAHTR